LKAWHQRPTAFRQLRQDSQLNVGANSTRPSPA
jgi:hypothetical protein